MEMYYCPNCNKKAGHKRHLGWGTFFGGIFTVGVSLLFIPFYPLRCIVCGNSHDPNRSQGFVDMDKIFRIEGSMEGLSEEFIIICPYCNRSIRSDSEECPYCKMFIPESMIKPIP